ncbi:MAG TPA: AraC family transcriptional regulator [Burkholderiaceae bacterium]|nr:AraC family transcriptional regulator [Burkholderiaceae bacterium]
MAFVRAMTVAYEKYGCDPGETLRRARITPAQLRRDDARITAAQMETISEAAMRELDDEALGWFGRRLPWGSYGMLCRASLTSPNLGVALKRWCRHHLLLVDDVELKLVVSSGRAELTIEERKAIDPRLREFCLLTLLRYAHGFACWLVDSRIPVHEVAFAHSAPPHQAAYGLMFPGPVSFDAATTRFGFDPAYLDLPIKRDEAALRAMLKRALPLTVLQYRRDRLVVQRVRELLPTQTTAEALSRMLNVSVRTLHRQLKDEGTSLQALKDQVRRDMAVEMLLRTKRSVKQIALASAFRNEKSFTRAFREWTGDSPSDYRRKMATADTSRRG